MAPRGSLLALLLGLLLLAGVQGRALRQAMSPAAMTPAAAAPAGAPASGCTVTSIAVSDAKATSREWAGAAAPAGSCAQLLSHSY